MFFEFILAIVKETYVSMLVQKIPQFLFEA
jgi:hypothetical protein